VDARGLLTLGLALLLAGCRLAGDGGNVAKGESVFASGHGATVVGASPARSVPRPESEVAGSTTATTVDPEFASLAQTLPLQTHVPVWLPERAPRAPEAGLRCHHYGLVTRDQSTHQVVSARGYTIVMVC